MSTTNNTVAIGISNEDDFNNYRTKRKRLSTIFSLAIVNVFLTFFSFCQTTTISGDFDGDGKYDIGAYISEEGNFIIKYGDGKGTFTGQTVFSWGPFEFGDPFTGDFNGDKYWDVGFYNPNGNGDWFIWYGDGKGHFANQTAFHWGPFGNSNPLTGDFNGDGLWDIGQYNPNGDGNWFFWYGEGNGQFKNQTAFHWGAFRNSNPITGDFNGDRKWDIGQYNPNGNGDWFIWYGDGNGQFMNQTAYGWGPFSTSNPFSGDFNGDGKCDIGVYNPNLDHNWFIKYGNGSGSFDQQTVWNGGNPSKDWNPCCSNNEFILSKNAGFYFEKSESTENLRKAMCIPESSPLKAPQYSGAALYAYQYISNQLYPGSEGNIRSFYNSINLDWGTIIWPEYNAKACNCGSKVIFDSVKLELRKEIQAVSNIEELFNSLSNYYINPLFISKENVVSSVVTNINLPAQTTASISTSDIIENTILSFISNEAEDALAEVNPYAPMVLSALMNYSKESNGGSIPDKLQVEIATIESDLVNAFTGILNQVSVLKDSILSDYAIYMKLGRYSAPLTQNQLVALVDSASIVYERQLYKDLIPLACNIVFYDPNDNHLGGGGNVYGAPATNYSQPSNSANNIGYKHDAGYIWSSSSYYSTSRQLLTSNSIYNSGDAMTGELDANYCLSEIMYQTLFDKLGFTYGELLSLPGMVTYYQCSLCSTDSGCCPNCRSASSRGD